MSSEPKILIGWREWVALPNLGLPAIKAKVDTGARTSSLHAFDVEPYMSERGESRVRFKVHPLNHTETVVQCSAPIADYRTVSDSGGHREKRFVIVTDLVVGELRFPIEITLANRETMSHRMLFGRTAMKSFVIEPAHSFLLGRPEKVRSLYGSFHGSLNAKKKKKKSARKAGK